MAADQGEARTTTGAQGLVRAIERAGITVVFGVPGTDNLPVVAELRAQGVRFIAVQQPLAALHAAIGHSGRTGRPGMALAGPTANLLPLLDGLHHARQAGEAVLVLTTPTGEPDPGEVTALDGLDVDVVALQAADDLPAELKHARDSARQAPGGPVVLRATSAMLAATLPPEVEDAEATEAPATAAEPAPRVEHVQLRRAANLVDTSQNILIWAGGGALRAGAGGAIAELAEKVGAPVVTTANAAGLLPARHPCLVGLPPHLPAVGALWDDANLVVGIGTDFDHQATQGGAQPAPTALIAINVDPADAGRNYHPDVLLRGDARILTKALADAVNYRGGTAVVRAKLDEIRTGVRRRLESAEPVEAAFVSSVSAALPDRATVVADPSTAGRWLAAFHEWTLPRTLLLPPDADRLGTALATAIGAAAAGSTEPVVAVMGDQGLLADLGELTVLAREKLPVTLVVTDDGGAGRLRPRLEELGLDPAALDRPSPDFAAIARAAGLRADTVDVLGEELTNALRAHIAAPDPTMLVVQTRLGPPPTDEFRWYRAARAREVGVGS